MKETVEIIFYCNKNVTHGTNLNSISIPASYPISQGRQLGKNYCNSCTLQSICPALARKQKPLYRESYPPAK